MSIWEVLLELIPIDEWIFKRFTNRKKDSSDEDGKKSHPLRERLGKQKGQILQGIGIFWGKIPDESNPELKGIDRQARENLLLAMEELPEEDQDRCKVALSELCEQLIDGIFPATLTKVVEKIPYKQENKKGETVTVWKDKTTEGLLEKPGWDPGIILVTALNEAGRDMDSARRFWRMMLQASPWQRLTKETDELWEKVTSSPAWGYAWRTFQAWGSLLVISIILAVVGFMATVSLGFEQYRWTALVYGGVAFGLYFVARVLWYPVYELFNSVHQILREKEDEGRFQKMLESVKKHAGLVGFVLLFLSLVPMEVLSAQAVATFIMALVAFWAPKGWMRVVAGSTVVIITLMALWPMAASAFSQEGGDSSASVATVVHKARIWKEEVAATMREDTMFFRGGVAIQCRPTELDASVAVEQNWWHEFVYPCNGDDPGVDPKLGLQGRRLTPGEALRYHDWREEKRREAETTSQVVRVSHKAPLRPEIVYASVGFAGASVSIPRGWGVRPVYADGPFKAICYPSGKEVEYLGGELSADKKCKGRVTGVEYRSLSDTEVPVRLRWFRLR